MVKLSEKEVQKIEEKIREGFIYAAEDEISFGIVGLFKEKPERIKLSPKSGSSNVFYSENSKPELTLAEFYHKFVTYQNSPVYLPDVVEKQKEMRGETMGAVEFLLKTWKRMCEAQDGCGLYINCDSCEMFKTVGDNCLSPSDFENVEKMVKTVENWSKNHPEIILTEQQKTAIRGRIAEGAKWIARDGCGNLCVYTGKPDRHRTMFDSSEYDYEEIDSAFDIYDFVTWGNSPIDLQALLDNQTD